MKNIFKLIIATFTITTLSAQEVKLKKGIVLVDNSVTFSYTKKRMGNELYVYKLNSEEEYMQLVVDNNNTESKIDDSKKIIFTKQNTTIQSKNFRNRNYEFLIALLLEEKVIDVNGDVDSNNLTRFKAKYDEKNSNQTMR